MARFSALVCIAAGLSCSVVNDFDRFQYEPCVPGNEICNGRDDDCDGLTDEDFDFDRDPLHCGECNRACGEFGPGTECVAGGCVLPCPPDRARKKRLAIRSSSEWKVTTARTPPSARSASAAIRPRASSPNSAVE